MTLYSLDGIAPEHPDDGDVWIAPDANVIGRVRLETGTSVWFGATLRGDNEPVVVGAGSNLQERVICHTDPDCPLSVGRDVTVGHGAILHGCTIHDEVLIGMGATVLNGAVIGAGSLIGAGALVPEGREIPPRSLVMGTPGRVTRELDDAALQEIRDSARHYRDQMRRFRHGLSALG